MLGINEKIKKFTKERKFNKQYSIFTSFLCVLTAAGVLSSLVMPAISATKIADDSTENNVNLLIGDNSYGSDITTVTNNLNNKFALGVASQFSVFLNGGFTIDEADTEGRIACAGGIDAKGYSDNYGYWDSYGNWQNAYYNIGKGHWYDNNTSIGFGDLGLNDDAAKVISNGGKFDYCSIQHWGGQYNNDFGYRYAFLEKNGFPANITVDYSKWWVYKYTNENDIIDFTSTFELLENRSKIIAENAENIADYANHPTVEVKKDENKVIFDGNKDGQTATAVTFNITSQQWAEINQMSGDKIHFEFKNIPQLATSIPGKEVNSNGNVDDVTWQSSYIMINVDAGTNVEIPNKDLRTSINGEFISKDDNGNLNNKFGCASLLYNFKDATSLTLGRNFQGTILAPKASVTDHGRIQHDDGSYGASGHLSGALVAQSFDGSMEFGYRPYQGPIEVIEKTYKVTIDKLAKDANGNETTTHLAGATFEIYKLGENDVRGEKVATIITSDNKDNDYVMLPAGRYELVETHAPQGYIKNSESIKFEVIAPSSRKIIRRPTTTQTSTEITISDETSNVNDTTQDDNLLLDQNDTDTTGEQDTMSLFSIQSRSRAMILNGDANDTYPYDYTIENILSTYNIFSKGNVTSATHIYGGVVSGGNVSMDAFGDGQVSPSYFKNIISTKKDPASSKIYYDTNNGDAELGNNYEQNANYIDIDKAFKYINYQSKLLTVGATEVSTAGQYNYLINLNIDTSKTNNFKIPYSAWNTAKGLNFKISDTDKLRDTKINISIVGVGNNDINLKGSAANIYSINGSEKALLVNVDDWGNNSIMLSQILNYGTEELLNGMKLVFNFPDATGTIDAKYNSGHIVAPNANVICEQIGGCVIANTFNATNEIHFHSYNAISNSNVPTTTNTYETASLPITTPNEGQNPDGYTEDISGGGDESSTPDTPTKGKITVVKHWSGDNENDRPNDIGDVKVYRSTNSTFDGNASELSTVSLYKGESWQKEISEFDIPNDGQTYYYFVRETSIPTGYSSSPTYNDGKQLDNNGNATLEITNIKEGGTTPDPTPDKGKLKITKQWKNNDGSNNTENHNQIEVKIKKNGSEVETVQLNSDNSWTVEREYDINSNETYTVEEINRPSDYDVSYENNNGVQLNKGYTQEIKVINTKKPTQTTVEKGSIKVKKEWQNDNNGDGRPSSVTFKLYRSTESNNYNGVTSNEGNRVYVNGTSEWTLSNGNWETTINNLEIKNSSNQDYYYYVKEVSVSNYKTEYSNNNGVKAVNGTSSGSGDNWITLNGVANDYNGNNYAISDIQSGDKIIVHVDKKSGSTNNTFKYKYGYTKNDSNWTDTGNELISANAPTDITINIANDYDRGFELQIYEGRSDVELKYRKDNGTSSGSTAQIPEITITNTKQNSSSSSSSVPDSSSEDSSSTPYNPEEDVQILSGDGTITVYNQKEPPKTGTLGIIKKWQDADGSSVAAPVSEVEFEVYRSTSSIAQPENFQNNSSSGSSSSSSSATDTPTETTEQSVDITKNSLQSWGGFTYSGVQMQYGENFKFKITTTQSHSVQYAFCFTNTNNSIVKPCFDINSFSGIQEVAFEVGSNGEVKINGQISGKYYDNDGQEHNESYGSLNQNSSVELQIWKIDSNNVTNDNYSHVNVTCFKLVEKEVSGGDDTQGGNDDGNTTTSGKGHTPITPNLPTDAILIDTIELNSGNNWQKELPNLRYVDDNGNPYYYYVVEKTNVSGFNVVAYGDDNTPNGISFSNATATGDKKIISVTNEKIETTGVVMPSTGGTGYSKFYIAGGTISIISLALFALKKKKA